MVVLKNLRRKFSEGVTSLVKPARAQGGGDSATKHSHLKN